MELPTYGTATCRHCGEEFTRLTTEQVYCTQKCRWNWWYREKMRRSPVPLVRLPFRQCAACEEWFRPWQRRQTCCGAHCRRMLEWSKNRRICECEFCGRLTLSGRLRRYCGPRCVSAANRKSRGSATGFVYFVQGESGGPVKIGVASDVRTRIALLQNGNPDRLVLLGTQPGGFPRERELHRRFARHRLLGEWFAPVPQVLAAAAGDRPQLQLVA